MRLRWMTCLVLALPVLAQDDPMARYGWLRDLCGACWSGTLPDGATTDTQCYEERLGRFIFGTIRIGAAFQGEGLLAWDPKASGVVFYFWGSNGDHGKSEVAFEGERILFPQAPRPGSLESRSSWTRIDAGSFRVTREQKTDGAWSEKFSVIYKRAAETH